MAAVKINRRFLAGTFAAVAVGLGMIYSAPARADPCRLDTGTTHSVAKVIDGETLALDDGREVRLIGALAPKAIEVGAEAGAWPPEIAAHAALRRSSSPKP